MKVDISMVLSSVCDYYDTTPERIFKKTRQRYIASKRQMFYYMATKWTDKTLGSIGETGLGFNLHKQDHATVLYGRNKIKGDLDIKYTDTITAIQDIEKIIETKRHETNNLVITDVDLLGALNYYFNNLPVIYSVV